jgi:hypothetical protein
VKVLADPFTTVTPMVYEPAKTEGAEVTCSVVDALSPGLTLRLGEARVAVNPVGAATWTVKVEALQLLLLSMFVTETV